MLHTPHFFSAKTQPHGWHITILFTTMIFGIINNNSSSSSPPIVASFFPPTYNTHICEEIYSIPYLHAHFHFHSFLSSHTYHKISHSTRLMFMLSVLYYEVIMCRIQFSMFYGHKIMYSTINFPTCWQAVKSGRGGKCKSGAGMLS